MDLHGGNIYGVEKAHGIPRREIVDFSSNINPLGIPESVRKALVRCIDEITQYPDPDYVDLRNALAAYNRIEPSQVIPSNGAIELLFLAARVLKPRRALIVAPTFMEYERAVSLAGGLPFHFRLLEHDRFALDRAGLIEELRNGYDLVVLCNPNNPTGAFIERDGIVSIVESALRRVTFVIVDEAFIEFAEGGLSSSMGAAAAAHPNLLVLRSLTKFFALPGLRLGYGISGSGHFIKKLRDAQEPWSVNIPAARAGEAIVVDREYISRTLAWLTSEREFLHRELSTFPSLAFYRTHANFILIRLGGSHRAGDLREALITKGILIRDASNFTYLDDRFIRIAIKDRRSNERLLEAMRGILQ